MDRRKVIGSLSALSAASLISSCETKAAIMPATVPNEQIKLAASDINHSVCQWCYSKMPLEELAEHAKDIGLKSIELLRPDQWDTVLLRGLTCAVGYGYNKGLTEGFNDFQLHLQMQQELLENIPKAADKGIPTLICFSGNRNGVSDKQGLEICARGLDPVMKVAEKYGVQIVMELLNSKVDHIDYQCDHTSWGVALVEKLGSTNFKLLYDIYHMQIMEGDVIRTIRDNQEYIGHYHTGGVPGRNEIDETQELYYPAIMKAIADTGFKGYVAQEFIPSRGDDMASLRQGVEICNIRV